MKPHAGSYASRTLKEDGCGYVSRCNHKHIKTVGGGKTAVGIPQSGVIIYKTAASSSVVDLLAK